jgi:hypothetical protein
MDCLRENNIYEKGISMRLMTITKQQQHFNKLLQVLVNFEQTKAIKISIKAAKHSVENAMKYTSFVVNNKKRMQLLKQLHKELSLNLEHPSEDPSKIFQTIIHHKLYAISSALKNAIAKIYAKDVGELLRQTSTEYLMNIRLFHLGNNELLKLLDKVEFNDQISFFGDSNACLFSAWLNGRHRAIPSNWLTVFKTNSAIFNEENKNEMVHRLFGYNRNQAFGEYKDAVNSNNFEKTSAIGSRLLFDTVLTISNVIIDEDTAKIQGTHPCCKEVYVSNMIDHIENLQSSLRNGEISTLASSKVMLTHHEISSKHLCILDFIIKNKSNNDPRTVNWSKGLDIAAQRQ